MSNLSRAPKTRGGLTSDFAPRRKGWRARAPWYAAIALLVVLVLAYIDGGEEPIRPITQEVPVQGAVGQ